MKHLPSLPLLGLSLSLFLGCARGPETLEPPAPSAGAINAEIGDESFAHGFGRAPTASDDDALRITTHLRFVEATLRARDVSHLGEAQRTARVRNLDRLNAYARAGAFPRNEEGTARLPRFVEPGSEGSPRRVCAVGAIAEPDLGSEVIDAIAARYEHDYIASIHDPVFEKWAATSGLTPSELAMIQPSYDFMHRPPPESELTDSEIRARLQMDQGPMNDCVHATLSPRQAHPAELFANLVIATDGSVRDVVISGTENARIKACAERVVSETRFRSSTKPKRSAHTFAIIGPRTADGALEPAYLPHFFQRAHAGVNRCGATLNLSLPDEASAFIRVVSELSSDGTVRVTGVHGDAGSESVPRAFSACVMQAVGSLAGPTFRGPTQSHSHVYLIRFSSSRAQDRASMDF